MQTTAMQICYAPRLRERTTMHLGGAAIAEVLLNGDEAFAALPETLKKLGGTPFVLGAGSNILAADADLPLVLIRPNFTEQSVQVQEQDGVVIVAVDAAMKLPSLLAFAAKHGLTGLEGLCGIPGSVGGAVFMNAGSYGVEMGSLVQQVQVITPAGSRILLRDQLQFSYRHSVIVEHEPWFLLTRVWLALRKGNPESIRLMMREHFMKKRSTQPIGAWSAGCVFKNPVGFSAGKLLDEAGFKGKELGGMLFSPMHANFLINTGAGTFTAAWDLIQLAQQAVKERFAVDLELEVRIWR